MFRDVKVGDRVWDVQCGWGVVEEVGADDFDVQFAEPDLDGDSVDGIYLLDGRPHAWVRNPTLFWDEIEIKAPEKPVRLVERTFEGWVNLYGNMQPYFRAALDMAVRSVSDDSHINTFPVRIIVSGVPEGFTFSNVEGWGLNEVA